MNNSVDDQRTRAATPSTLEPPTTLTRPSRGWVALNLQDLWQYRELLYFLTWRDIKVRYKQTVLGAAWAVFQVWKDGHLRNRMIERGLRRCRLFSWARMAEETVAVYDEVSH